MKVVINAMSARLGGGQTYLRNLLQHIPDRNDLSILVFAPKSLKLPTHPHVKRVTTAWPTESPVLRAVWERFILPNFLRREEADVLFCPGGVVATRVPLGCRVVTMFRNMIPFDSRVRRSVPWGLQRIRNWILYHVMLKSMAGADLTIFISEHARSVIESLVPIRNPVTIPHGIGEVFRTHGKGVPCPTFLTVSDYILYVSRFDVYKHHNEVVSAYARLPASMREKFPLILVGEVDMPEAQRVKALIARLGLGGQVQMVGAVRYDDLPAVYQHAKLILFASSCENCPNILLEALASGRPVMSSNVLPMPEFGGKAVAYFSPFDPEEISLVMKRLLTDETYARFLGSAAAERSAIYDWNRSAVETWASIFRLLNER